MEKRVRILETMIEGYGRRHDDCEKERALMQATLKEILSWKETIQESTEVNREMVEVGKNILLALQWVGVASKWVITIGGAFLVFFNAFKWLVGRVHL